jgi:hypothetical protein
VDAGTVVYRAGPREANRVVVTRVGDAVRVADAGAPLAAGAGCRALDARSALCSGANRANVRTGDRDDTVIAHGVAVNADAGAGEDTLRGAGPADVLRGGRGPDLVIGGGGADDMFGGPGEDFIFATRHGPDRASCGRGPNDTVVGANRRDRVGGGCELSFYAFTRTRSMELGPNPVRRDRASATFRLRCPSSAKLDGATIPMTGSLAVRAGHRLLGAAPIPALGRRCGSRVDVPPHVDVRVPLAPTRAARVVVSLHGHNVPHTGWSIRLSSPS